VSIDVFEQRVTVESVRWRRNESEMLIEPAGVFVLGVDRKGADACDAGGLECPQHRILEKTRTDPLGLRSPADREPGEQDDRHGTAGQALGQSFGRGISRVLRSGPKPADYGAKVLNVVAPHPGPIPAWRGEGEVKRSRC
jgi:hypothetical protein